MDENIKNILPAIADEQLAQLNCLLTDLGVETWDDLHHVEVNDLTGVLKPVQARKLIHSWSNGLLSKESYKCSSESLSNGTSEAAEDWDFSLDIPWQHFPKSLLEACEKGDRPANQDRLQMIRALVDDIHKVNSCPKKRNCERTSEKIVRQYPNSFKDVVGGVVIGTGVQSLASQILYRSGNLRNANKKNRVSAKVKASEACQSEQSDLNDNIEELKVCFLLKERDQAKITQMMKNTYPLQRQDIQTKMLVKEFHHKWPFILEEYYLFQHYETLMGCSDAKQNFVENLAYGADKIFATLECCTNPRIAQLVGQIKEEARQLKEEKPKSVGVIKLVTTYFNEDSSAIYQCFEGSTVSQILKEGALPAHPVIGCLGATIASAENFAVFMEGIVAMETTSFFVALAYVFCSYFVFEMAYPIAATATLELIQRYFARIGGKRHESSKKKMWDVHPKVLKLCKEVMRHQGCTL